MLSQICRGIGRSNAQLALAFLIREVNDFFNVKGKMNDVQVAMTTELIIDNPGFHDLTLANIKACFREKMCTAKLYDRIDGNIILGWIREFKSDMADWCETYNQGRDRAEQRREMEDGTDAISFNTYLAMLEAKANDGDKEAAETLADLRKRSRIPTSEQRDARHREFLKFKADYLKRKREERNGAYIQG
ncbi:MAG: hypothetical protein K2H21_06250 [Muribaculaceae bacterium]|nr:hypothetical protein [Muribaculaceae bacterium]